MGDQGRHLAVGEPSFSDNHSMLQLHDEQLCDADLNANQRFASSQQRRAATPTHDETEPVSSNFHDVQCATSSSV